MDESVRRIIVMASLGLVLVGLIGIIATFMDVFSNMIGIVAIVGDTIAIIGVLIFWIIVLAILYVYFINRSLKAKYLKPLIIIGVVTVIGAACIGAITGKIDPTSKFAATPTPTPVTSIIGTWENDTGINDYNYGFVKGGLLSNHKDDGRFYFHFFKSHDLTNYELSGNWKRLEDNRFVLNYDTFTEGTLSSMGTFNGANSVAIIDKYTGKLTITETNFGNCWMPEHKIFIDTLNGTYNKTSDNLIYY